MCYSLFVHYVSIYSLPSFVIISWHVLCIVVTVWTSQRLW